MCRSLSNVHPVIKPCDPILKSCPVLSNGHHDFHDFSRVRGQVVTIQPEDQECGFSGSALVGIEKWVAGCDCPSDRCRLTHNSRMQLFARQRSRGRVQRILKRGRIEEIVGSFPSACRSFNDGPIDMADISHARKVQRFASSSHAARQRSMSSLRNLSISRRRSAADNGFSAFATGATVPLALAAGLEAERLRPARVDIGLFLIEEVHALHSNLAPE